MACEIFLLDPHFHSMPTMREPQGSQPPQISPGSPIRCCVDTYTHVYMYTVYRPGSLYTGLLHGSAWHGMALG